MFTAQEGAGPFLVTMSIEVQTCDIDHAGHVNNQGDVRGLKTPGKIVIEDNDFSSHMSSIFFRGETFHWYESGAVEDVLIRNNRFDYCAYSGMEHAVLRITLGLGQAFDSTIPFDRNTRFVDNEIKTFDPRIVWADRVERLVIKNNVITQSHHDELLRPKAAMFEFTQCRDVEIMGNTFEGSFPRKIQVDEATRPPLTVEGNSRIQIPDFLGNSHFFSFWSLFAGTCIECLFSAIMQGDLTGS